MHKIFEAFIRDNQDGRLDKKEFQNLYVKLKGLAPNETTNKIDYIFDEFDKDKSGRFVLFDFF